MPIEKERKKGSFENLRIFVEARALANRIYNITGSQPFSRDFVMVDQMRRSAVSILSNIAEGFERQSRSEFVRFLFIAKGSCGELRAQLMLALDRKYISKQDFEELDGRCRKLGGGMFRLIEYLKKKKSVEAAEEKM